MRNVKLSVIKSLASIITALHYVINLMGTNDVTTILFVGRVKCE